jgi:hypothetical protein
VLAIVIALHGGLFAIASASLSRADNPLPETLGEAYFFLLSAPALILAMPFSPLLWRWHLMASPGWFAWPEPAGFLLVYIAWVVALLVLARRMLSLR